MTLNRPKSKPEMPTPCTVPEHSFMCGYRDCRKQLTSIVRNAKFCNPEHRKAEEVAKRRDERRNKHV